MDCRCKELEGFLEFVMSELKYERWCSKVCLKLTLGRDFSYY